MPTGDALLSECCLQCAYRRGEYVGLLQDLRWVRSVQRAEHRAVVQLHTLKKLKHRKLVSPRLCVPVNILEKRGKNPNISFHIATPETNYKLISLT